MRQPSLFACWLNLAGSVAGRWPAPTCCAAGRPSRREHVPARAQPAQRRTPGPPCSHIVAPCWRRRLARWRHGARVGEPRRRAWVEAEAQHMHEGSEDVRIAVLVAQRAVHAGPHLTQRQAAIASVIHSKKLLRWRRRRRQCHRLRHPASRTCWTIPDTELFQVEPLEAF